MGYDEFYYYAGIIGVLVCLPVKLKDHKKMQAGRFPWLYSAVCFIIAAIH